MHPSGSGNFVSAAFALEVCRTLRACSKLAVSGVSDGCSARLRGMIPLRTRKQVRGARGENKCIPAAAESLDAPRLPEARRTVRASWVLGDAYVSDCCSPRHA